MDEFEKRSEIAEKTGYNVFNFPSREIPGCDLLSDSGTTTMTVNQWSSLLLGDEAYGTNEGYEQLEKQAGETFGPAWKDFGQLFLFHQGRAAEHALFTAFKEILSKKSIKPGPFSSHLSSSIKMRLEGKSWKAAIIPSNSHFDTTGANILNCGMLPLNLPCKEHLNEDENFCFRGNINTEELKNLLDHAWEKVPIIYITITNNTGGGQPVSMENIRKTAETAKSYKIPFFFDACRFAENAWFIKKHEKGYHSRTIVSIIHEMFSHADGFHISLKKDGMVNMGGAILLRRDGRACRRYPDLAEKLTDHQILTEGHPTYGGMAGRDLMGAAEGLRTVTGQDYLDYRIGQVKRFGHEMAIRKIPILRPVGGHAVYVKTDDFFKDIPIPKDSFMGISLTALLLIAGHRFCELGLYAFGRFNEKEHPPKPRVNYVRGAVPRLVYEEQDLTAASEAVKILFENRDRIPEVEVIHGRELSLRHFKSRFSFF